MIASLIARYEFADPDELVEIIDSAGTPCADEGEQERKRCKKNSMLIARPTSWTRLLAGMSGLQLLE